MLTLYNTTQRPIFRHNEMTEDRPVRLAKKKTKKVKWKPEEQEALHNAIQKFGNVWTKVSLEVGRTEVACKNKYEHIQISKRPLEVSEFEFIQQTLTQLKKTKCRVSWKKVETIFNRQFSTQLDSRYLRRKYYNFKRYKVLNLQENNSMTETRQINPSLSRTSSSFSSAISHSIASDSNHQSFPALETNQSLPVLETNHLLPMSNPIHPLSSPQSQSFMNSIQTKDIESTSSRSVENNSVITHSRKRKISMMEQLWPFTKNTRRIPKSELS